LCFVGAFATVTRKLSVSLCVFVRRFNEINDALPGTKSGEETDATFSLLLSGKARRLAFLFSRVGGISNAQTIFVLLYLLCCCIFVLVRFGVTAVEVNGSDN
jgi:hypothetical protein